VATFAFGLTQTAEAMPTTTETPNPSPSPTASLTLAPTNTPSTITTTVASCYGLAYISDITVPDNTRTDPGEEFTKTWRVENNGTCAWEQGFRFTYIGGEAMGASAITLQESVEPGEEFELSVDLVAPQDPGTYQGNWRMATDAIEYFGDVLYVLIEVGGADATSTAQAQAATATFTPEP
jgi:uncharacterized protein affecting Mg2+/Co2+ transport